ncbi:MAG: Antibiotic biosynthesis monooxygenase [Bacteroidetes bacterium]|jgi:quinol monooxygenase YgiN|nr:Antibiotic biosynthesis monooxygenase [Bacteroidota bacterium]
MIRLNVFLQTEGGNNAKVLEAAKELTAASLKEEGCIAYDVFESATRPGILLICETWADEATLATHEKSEAFLKNILVFNESSKIKIEKFEF